MITVKLIRGPQQPDVNGTKGKLYVGETGPSFDTYELIWRNNLNVPPYSRIPVGSYPVIWTITDKHPDGVFMLQNTGVRIAIEMHIGNFAGDTTQINPVTGLAYLSDVDGCIIIGQGYGILKGQMALLNSKESVTSFNSIMNQQPFMLEVTDDFES